MAEEHILRNHRGWLERTQPCLVLAVELLDGGPVGGPHRAGFALDQLPVMIAANVDPAPLRHQQVSGARCLERPRQVIAQVHHHVRRVRAQVRENGFERQQIPVYVSQDGDSHGSNL
jgi:hypothetical protein